MNLIYDVFANLSSFYLTFFYFSKIVTPLRFIQIGGKFGDKVIMPTQKMLENTRNQINKMDLKSGLVVPFYVKAETYGTEGQVLNTEDKVKEVKEDVIVALGVAKSLVTGDEKV